MSIDQLNNECEGIQNDGKPPKKLFLFSVESGEFVVPRSEEEQERWQKEYDQTVTFRLRIVPHPDAPQCPDCRRPMDAAGGIVGADPPMTSWACRRCLTWVHDTPVEEVKPKQLTQ